MKRTNVLPRLLPLLSKLSYSFVGSCNFQFTPLYFKVFNCIPFSPTIINFVYYNIFSFCIVFVELLCVLLSTVIFNSFSDFLVFVASSFLNSFTIDLLVYVPQIIGCIRDIDSGRGPRIKY